MTNEGKKACSQAAGIHQARPPRLESRGPCTDRLGQGSRTSEQAKCYLKILKIWSISESPGNNGWPRMHISAKMQPTDHMSIAVE